MEKTEEIHAARTATASDGGAGNHPHPQPPEAIACMDGVAVSGGPHGCEETTARDWILRETKSRLVWSRLHEVEKLKAKLQELSCAIGKVDDIRKQLENSVDESLADASELAATHMEGQAEIYYSRTFSQLFRDLVGYLSCTTAK